MEMSNKSCDTLQVMRGNEKKTNKEWDIQGKAKDASQRRGQLMWQLVILKEEDHKRMDVKLKNHKGKTSVS